MKNVATGDEIVAVCSRGTTFKGDENCVTWIYQNYALAPGTVFLFRLNYMWWPSHVFLDPLPLGNTVTWSVTSHSGPNSASYLKMYLSEWVSPLPNHRHLFKYFELRPYLFNCYFLKQCNLCVSSVYLTNAYKYSKGLGIFKTCPFSYWAISF